MIDYFVPFHADQVTPDMTSMSIGTIWLYYADNLLCAVHAYSQQEFYILNENRRWTKTHIDTVMADISSTLDPVYVSHKNLQDHALRLAAAELQRIVDKELGLT